MIRQPLGGAGALVGTLCEHLFFFAVTTAFTSIYYYQYFTKCINTLPNVSILLRIIDIYLYLILRIDKQEYSSIFNAESSNVAKLNRLKKKFSLNVIASKILSLLLIYKSIQYKLRKSLLYISNRY